MNKELGRSGAEPLETGKLSLQVAELEVGLRHASRREDANNVISELIQAAKENETNLEFQVSKTLAEEESNRRLTKQINQLSIKLKNSQAELESKPGVQNRRSNQGCY